MIAVDSNVLVAAHRRDAAGHAAAEGAVRALADRDFERFGGIQALNPMTG